MSLLTKLAPVLLLRRPALDKVNLITNFFNLISYLYLLYVRLGNGAEVPGSRVNVKPRLTNDAHLASGDVVDLDDLPRRQG